MKRSTMLKIIEEQLCQIDSNYNTTLEAEILLTKLEGYGMKPPTVSNALIVIGRDGKTGKACAFDISGKPINAWEAESEDWEIYKSARNTFEEHEMKKDAK